MVKLLSSSYWWCVGGQTTLRGHHLQKPANSGEQPGGNDGLRWSAAAAAARRQRYRNGMKALLTLQRFDKTRSRMFIIIRMFSRFSRHKSRKGARNQWGVCYSANRSNRTEHGKIIPCHRLGSGANRSLSGRLGFAEDAISRNQIEML